DEFFAEASGDPEVRALLTTWTERLAGLTYCAPGPPRLLYADSVYSLILGTPATGRPRNDFEKLREGSLYGAPLGGVSIGLWARVRWVDLDYLPHTVVAMPAMSRDLLARLEPELGRTLGARFCWKGLATPTTRRGFDMEFGGAGDQDITWLTPRDLRLEIINAAGEVVYTLR
ncbi:MAG: hypothetical protein KDA24_27975, partial [Deltaproteobacteria bacterium]|nr:hypothetical protein [Deltaproteobacteria bacterium]